MQIGAIGGMSFMPYIYNTNAMSRASMNKVAAIDDDVTSSKTDFSALTQETTNPLKRGESLEFASILGMQMQMGRMNASRLFKEPEQTEETTQAAGISSEETVSAMMDKIAEKAQESAGTGTVTAPVQEESQMTNVFEFAKAMQAYQPINLLA